MLISNKIHYFRNFNTQIYYKKSAIPQFKATFNAPLTSMS